MTNVNGVMLFTDEDKASPSFPYAVQKAVVASCGSFELGVEDGD